MKRTGISGLCAAGAVVAATLASSLGVGMASAATTGLDLSGIDSGNCTATITLVNHTNATFYQPDWWFGQENDLALVNAMENPPTMPAPWRAVNGVPWPIARWVGDPPLHSEVGPGVPVWTPGVNAYNSSAQPEGFVTEKTIDLKTVTDAPPAASDGTKTIWFRLKTGPATADRLPTPQQLVVHGCADTPGGGSSVYGSSGTGSVDLGVLFK